MSFNPKPHLMTLKGKEYLEVKYRLVWLSEDVPHYLIDTNIVETPQGAKGVTVRATVQILERHAMSGDLIAARSATAYKSSAGFAGGDLEKAETGAIGRALALLGFGTAFAQELETDTIEEPVDSPAKVLPVGVTRGTAEIPVLTLDEKELLANIRNDVMNSYGLTDEQFAAFAIALTGTEKWKNAVSVRMLLSSLSTDGKPDDEKVAPRVVDYMAGIEQVAA